MNRPRAELGADASAAGHLTEDFDAIVVGAGFAGLYMLYRLRQLGMRVRVLEAGSDVGGTWFWNRYPGARCDAESLLYSYSFSEALQQEWNWSERYAGQREILAYLNHVADRFDLRRDIRFGVRVERARFDDASGIWIVHAASGDVLRARYCIMATGALSAPKTPEIKGLETFAGDSYTTGTWPAGDVDFSGKRVGVIGTGSSGIQVIPVIAGQAAHLTVFQRTPAFSIPARNAPLEPDQASRIKSAYTQIRVLARTGILSGFGDIDASDADRAAASARSLAMSAEERDAVLEQYWRRGGGAFLSSFPQTYLDQATNDEIAGFVRRKITQIVKDPETAERLTPRNYPIGTKRICIDTNYYATFNRSNVSLIDVNTSPLECVTSSGITAGGVNFPLDAIVFATGFDALTGALLSMDILGTDGLRLRDKWSEGTRSYLGLVVSGFPNLFIVAGPGSPSVLSNVVVSIEQHVEWIGDCLEYMHSRGFDRIDAAVEAEDDWAKHVKAVADATLYRKGGSWYEGANIAGKPRVFMPYAGGVGAYREICDGVVRDGYKGFFFNGSADADSGPKSG